MLFLATQRAYNLLHSLHRIIPRKPSIRSSSYIPILSAFILVYLFEFFSLYVFCSSNLSADLAYQWFNYIRRKLSYETIHLIAFMKDQSTSQREINCIMSNETDCSREQGAQIVRKYSLIVAYRNISISKISGGKSFIL